MSNDIEAGDIIDLTPGKNFKTPDYSKPYRPTSASIEHFSWCNAMLPPEPSATPKMHYMIIDHVLQEKNLVQAMVHREGAKTTVVTKQLALRTAAEGMMKGFGLVHNMAIFSATYKQAVDILKGIRSMWEGSDQLYESMTLARDRSGKIIADKENHICFQLQNGQRVHLQAIGAGDSLRGTTKDNFRLELLFFDDILVDDILTSQKVRDKLNEWFVASVGQAVSTAHFKKILVGTPMVQDDILSMALEGKEYDSIKFPIAMEFPVSTGKMITSWPSLHTPEKVLASYKEAESFGLSDSWMRERMLQIVSDSSRIFKRDQIKRYSYADKRSSLHLLNIYTSMDLAIGKKKKNDDTVIMTVGIDSRKNIFVLDIDGGNFPPQETIKKLFNHVKKFNPLETRAEKASLQLVLNEFIEEKMEETGMYFFFEPLVYNSEQSKEFRIISLQPRFKKRRIFIPNDKKYDECETLISQLLGYTKNGKTTPKDDYVDCLANFNDEDFIMAPSGEGGTEVGTSSSINNIEKLGNSYS